MKNLFKQSIGKRILKFDSDFSFIKNYEIEIPSTSEWLDLEKGLKILKTGFGTYLYWNNKVLAYRKHVVDFILLNNNTLFYDGSVLEFDFENNKIEYVRLERISSYVQMYKYKDSIIYLNNVYSNNNVKFIKLYNGIKIIVDNKLIEYPYDNHYDWGKMMCDIELKSDLNVIDFSTYHNNYNSHFYRNNYSKTFIKIVLEDCEKIMIYDEKTKDYNLYDFKNLSTVYLNRYVIFDNKTILDLKTEKIYIFDNIVSDIKTEYHNIISIKLDDVYTLYNLDTEKELKSSNEFFDFVDDVYVFETYIDINNDDLININDLVNHSEIVEYLSIGDYIKVPFEENNKKGFKINVKLEKNDFHIPFMLDGILIDKNKIKHNSIKIYKLNK